MTSEEHIEILNHFCRGRTIDHLELADNDTLMIKLVYAKEFPEHTPREAIVIESKQPINAYFLDWQEEGDVD